MPKLQKILSAAITMLLFFPCLMSADTFQFGTNVTPDGVKFEVDSRGFIIGGKHVLPVMGEIHYARVPEKDWRREIEKMRAGGITVISTYCFWIHHEPVEGQWNWSGNRNLHKFLEICKEEHMPVVLRVGPFCHGEVYQGGFPEWLTDKAKADPKQYKLRSEAPGFIAAVQRLYSNIYAQASDMLWKNGGPVVGIQIENECRGPWSYYMRLKNMAVSIGFDVPFMTRTGWPKLNGKEEFGKLLPLYGDYADGFWDRSTADMPGDYPKSFIMKDNRISSVIATETFTKEELAGDKASNGKSTGNKQDYPYLTCELGGGMMQAYHRRINMSGNEAMPLAICKLGSGSNLPGYYMYHGGTNPYCAKHTMGETQKTAVTNYNDMPYMSYDFQCPLGEMGQPNLTAFHQTRWLHQFLADWGEELSQMDVDTLSEHYARRGCFEFFNDYVRINNEEGVAYVRPVNMPFCGHKITADAQPFCKTGSTLYFIQIKGKKPVAYVDGKKVGLKADKAVKVRDITLQLLSESAARKAYKINDEIHFAQHDGGILYTEDGNIHEEYWQIDSSIAVNTNQIAQAGEPRKAVIGAQKVASMPTNEDFDKAAVWTINLDLDKVGNIDNAFLQVDYEGDCARVYADGILVEDNFWNGKTMLVRISDLISNDNNAKSDGNSADNGGKKVKKIELRILPLAKDYPIYFQKAQRDIITASPTPLLKLNGVKVLRACNN